MRTCSPSPGSVMPARSARGLGVQPAVFSAGVRAPALQGMEPSIRQGFLILGIFVSAAGLAWVGLGAPVRILMPFCGLACAAWYRRRSPWLFLTATFWFWTLTPFIRRVIDYRLGFDPLALILATPHLMALLMLPDLLRSRTLWRRPQTRVVLLMLLPVTYGLGVGLVQGDLFPVAAGAADWFVPLVYFLYILENIPRIGQAEPHLRGFIALNSLVIVAYGLDQFFSPPPWDVSWALASGMLRGSAVQAQTIHVFGTLNSLGDQALWLGALILLSLHFRTRLTPLVLPLLCVLLSLTYVRSSTVGVLAAFGMVMVLGPRQMTARLAGMAMAVIVVAVILVSFNPVISDLVIDRLGSLSDLQNDNSAQVRSVIWASMPALVDAHPFGLGIGALGRGAAASGNADLVSIDSGPLSIYLALGWVGGTVYFLGMLAALAQAFIVALRVRSSLVLSCLAAAICCAAEFLLVNVIGFGGAVLWSCVGLIVAQGDFPTALARQGMSLPGDSE